MPSATTPPRRTKTTLGPETPIVQPPERRDRNGSGIIRTPDELWGMLDGADNARSLPRVYTLSNDIHMPQNYSSIKRDGAPLILVKLMPCDNMTLANNQDEYEAVPFERFFLPKYTMTDPNSIVSGWYSDPYLTVSWSNGSIMSDDAILYPLCTCKPGFKKDASGTCVEDCCSLNPDVAASLEQVVSAVADTLSTASRMVGIGGELLEEYINSGDIFSRGYNSALNSFSKFVEAFGKLQDSSATDLCCALDTLCGACKGTP